MEGLLVDGITGHPIPAGTIQIPGRKVSSGPNGHFILDDVPADRYLLLADKAGYLPARPEGRINGPPGIMITVIDDQPSLVVRLFPGGSIAGRIYGSGGDGLAAMVVIPYRSTYDAEGRVVLSRLPTRGAVSSREIAGAASLQQDLGAGATSSLSTGFSWYSGGQTNDRGEFRITNLDPGKYALYIVPMQNRPPDPVFSPGVTDPLRADIVEVESGRETDAGTIVLPVVPEARLYAQVINQTSQPQATGFVQVRRSGRKETLFQTRLVLRGPGSSCQSARGVCTEVGPLAPGSYDVEAVLTVGRGAFVAAASQHVEMGSTDVFLDLPVFDGVAVIGQVLSERSNGTFAPLSGVEIDFRSDETLPNITFSAASNANGAFTLPSVPKGSFRISRIVTLPGQCLRELRQGERDVLRESLEVSGTDVTLTATTQGSQAIINGTARTADGRPVPGAVVVLIPDERDRMDAYVSGVADQNGDFELLCVQRGSYRLFAWLEVEDNAYRNADFMQRYLRLGTSISVESHAAIVLDAVVFAD